MKGNKENIEDRLQEILDSRKDQGEIHGLINETDDLKKELQFIQDTDQLLRGIGKSNPRDGFAHRVMHKLSEEPVSKTVRKQGLLIFMGVVMVLMIVTFYLNSVSSTLVNLPEDVSLVGRSFSLDGLGSMFDTGIIIKGLMFITFFLSMLLLDRAILRPMLGKKRNFG